MVASRQDDAVSELIGFILLMAIIAIVAAYYNTYVVPEQGRNLEINHMAHVQNEFLGYKTSMDSLWINGHNTTITNPFILGPEPGQSGSPFMLFPLLQPILSSGAMRVSGTYGKTTLNIDATQYRSGVSPDATNSENLTSSISPTATPLTISSAPNHIYILVTTGPRTRYANETMIPGNSSVFIWNNGMPSWNITISAVPRIDYTNVNMNITTDVILTTSVKKQIGNQFYPVSREMMIKSDAAPNTVYPVDLVEIIDQVYNLNQNLTYPIEIQLQSQNLSGTNLFSTASIRVEYAYTSQLSKFTVLPPHTLGSLEYSSQNNYWVQQDYIYQMGGVFVVQNDGAVAKIPPAIMVTRSQADPSMALVSVTDFTMSGDSQIAYNGLVHVDTVSQVSGSGSVPQYRNADTVTITVDNANNKALAPAWNSAMIQVCQVASKTAGIPYVPGSSLGTSNWLKVTYGDSSNNYKTSLQVQGQNGLIVAVTPVNLKAVVQAESPGI